MEKKLTRNDAITELLRLLDLWFYGSFKDDEKSEQQVIDNIKFCRQKIAEIDKLKITDKEECARNRYKEKIGAWSYGTQRY